MCNIIVKKERISLMTRGIIPKEYRKDKEKKYLVEHDKYLAIKNELMSCKNKDERDNLETLFKCSSESYKRLYNIQDFAVFGMTLINMLLSCLALIISIIKTSDLLIVYKELLPFLYNMAFVLVMTLLVVLFSRNYSSRKQSEILYVLEIFNKLF